MGMKTRDKSEESFGTQTENQLFTTTIHVEILMRIVLQQPWGAYANMVKKTQLDPNIPHKYFQNDIDPIEVPCDDKMELAHQEKQCGRFEHEAAAEDRIHRCDQHIREMYKEGVRDL